MLTLDLIAVAITCLVVAALDHRRHRLTTLHRGVALVALWTVLMVVTSVSMRGFRPAYNSYDEMEGLASGIALGLLVGAVSLAYFAGNRWGLPPAAKLAAGVAAGGAIILLLPYVWVYLFLAASRLVSS